MIAGVGVEGLAIRRGERLLFEGLDLTIRAGEAVALMGRNGAGKTSLLRAIAGLLLLGAYAAASVALAPFAMAAACRNALD